MGTEGELHVKHEVKKHTKSPHVDLKPIKVSFITGKYLRRHELFSTEDGAADVRLFLTEAEICKFIYLSYRRVTSFPFSFFIKTF